MKKVCATCDTVYNGAYYTAMCPDCRKDHAENMGLSLRTATRYERRLYNNDPEYKMLVDFLAKPETVNEALHSRHASPPGKQARRLAGSLRAYTRLQSKPKFYSERRKYKC